MCFGRFFVLAAFLSAPAFAQSGYVFELDAGKLVPAKSTEGIAPSGRQPAFSGAAGASVSAPVPNRQVASATSRPAAELAEGGLYFRSCAEAAAAGYENIPMGTPGYRQGLDGDYDGVACEPYTGRRGSFGRRR
jgi:hypothetical protein